MWRVMLACRQPFTKRVIREPETPRELAVARGDGIDSGGLALHVLGEPAGRQIPSLHFDRGALSGAPAQREDAGDERQLAHLDAVYEILAPAVNGVVDLEGVG